MTSTVFLCEHVRAGAPVAGTLCGSVPVGPNRETATFQACSNCLAQASGASSQTGKGGYSASADYFGSKVDK